MDDTSGNKPDRPRLVEIASEHAGYFTTKEAKACGFSKALLSHHAKSGTFVRVSRGLYRLAEFPSSRHEEVMAAWLATGAQGVVSHESALDLLDLSDVIPGSIHITIPRRERWRRPPDGVTLHTTDTPIPRQQIQIREGIRVTSAARSIVDAAEAGTAQDHVEAAILSALDRGLTTKSELSDLAHERGGHVERLIVRSLKGMTS